MVWKMASVLSSLDDGPVGKDALHALFKDRPLAVAVEVIDHEEAAAEQMFAKELRLCVVPLPVSDLDGIEPGPVVVVAILDIDRLLDGADVDAGEAAHGGGEVAVGAGVIGGPAGVALAPVPRP